MKTLTCHFLIVLTLIVGANNVKAEAPVLEINYPSKIFKLNEEATPFQSVTNNGGVIPNEQAYSQVTTTTFMPPDNTAVAGNDDGAISTAKFNQPQGLTMDATGNIYVTERLGNRIRKIDFSTGQVTTIAGDNTTIAPGNANINGNGTAARFNQPMDVVMDSNGNLFVTEAGNYCIRKISPSGDVTHFAGSDTRQSGNVDATGLDARFAQPWGMTIDSSDNLYVVDRTNNCIRKITPAVVVSTFAGSGALGSADGIASAATFNYPTAIVIDSNGDFYIGDGGGNTLRKITTSTMIVSTIAGSGAGGATDGQGKNATFALPSGVAVDEYGVLYVSDKGYGGGEAPLFLGNKIRRITPEGIVMILAGNVSGGGGYQNGEAAGTTAKFRNPSDVLYDKTNRCLYVADCVNHTIRRINLTGYNITPALPVGLTFDFSSGEISGTPTVTSSARDYTISGFNTEGAGSAVMNIEVADDINSLSDKSINDNFIVYPTQVEDNILNIRLPDQIREKHLIAIYNATGKEVYHLYNNFNSNIVTIRLPELSSGLYFVLVEGIGKSLFIRK